MGIVDAGCRSIAFTWLAAVAILPALPVAAFSQGVGREVEPLFLPLPEWLRPRASMISGLAWAGDELLLLPQQRPSGGAVSPHRGKLYGISRGAIERAIAMPSDEPLPVTTWRLEAPGIDTLPGYQGLEAIAFAGERAFATVECDPPDGVPHAWLLAGTVDTTARVVRFEPPVVRIDGRSGIRNLTEEAIAVHGGDVVTFHEANGSAVNADPVAHVFAVERPAGVPRTIPMAAMEYRVTDATAVDGAGRFWVTNYLWPGDSALYAAADPLGPPPAGSASERVAQVERLVELRFSAKGIEPTGRPPVYIKPRGEGRNWEGVARMGRSGLLVAIDKFPDTRLAFVPFPEDRTGAQPWADVAVDDLHFIRAVLRENHPGPLDAENAAFSAWYRGGFEQALALARRSRATRATASRSSTG